MPYLCRNTPLSRTTNVSVFSTGKSHVVSTPRNGSVTTTGSSGWVHDNSPTAGGGSCHYSVVPPSPAKLSPSYPAVVQNPLISPSGAAEEVGGSVAGGGKGRGNGAFGGAGGGESIGSGSSNPAVMRLMGKVRCKGRCRCRCRRRRRCRCSFRCRGGSCSRALLLFFLEYGAGAGYTVDTPKYE